MSKQKKTPPASSKPASAPGQTNLSESSVPPGLELNLANHFLIAMPSMPEPSVATSVILSCEHNASGALGVIINKPTDMTMDMRSEAGGDRELARDVVGGATGKSVMFGGPVQ